MAAESFQVRIDGFRTTTFEVLEGLSGQIEVVEFQDGDDVVLRKRPGRVTFGNIVLKRGQLDSTEFYQWWYAVRAGKLDRRRVLVAFQDKARRSVMQFRFEAWPVSWKISADASERSGLIALETFTLAVESAELIS